MASYDDYRPVSKYSFNGLQQTVERTIQVRAVDELEAAAHADAPKRGDTIVTALGFLYLRSVNVSQVEGSAGDADSKFLWDVTGRFEPLDKSPTEGKARWSIQSQNESIRLTAVAEDADQTHYYPTPGSSDEFPDPYLGRGINVTNEGADGVEIDDPFEVLRIDLWLDPADVAAKLAAIRALRNHVNDAEFAGPWGTYDTGEVRLVGYNVSHLGEDLDQVSIEFQARNNVTFDIDLLGGQTAEVTKGGQQYYWQRNTKAVAGGDDTQAPVQMLDAHVATVYKDGDFSTLGITYAMFDMAEPS